MLYVIHASCCPLMLDPFLYLLLNVDFAQQLLLLKAYGCSWGTDRNETGLRSSCVCIIYFDLPWSAILTANWACVSLFHVRSTAWAWACDCEHWFRFVSVFKPCCLITMPSVCHWGCIVFLFCHPYLSDNCPCQIEGKLLMKRHLRKGMFTYFLYLLCSLPFPCAIVVITVNA